MDAKTKQHLITTAKQRNDLELIELYTSHRILEITQRGGENQEKVEILQEVILERMNNNIKGR